MKIIEKNIFKTNNQTNSKLLKNYLDTLTFVIYNEIHNKYNKKITTKRNT
jgi:hypothetical protein